MTADAGTDPAPRLRRSLVQKYFVVLFAAVVLPLLASGASEAWFGYLDRMPTLNLRLRAEANAAAARIQDFLDGIPSQMNWTVQAPWGEGLDQRHRIDVLRLMRQTPAIAEVTVVDAEGAERLRVSRTDPDVEMSGVDHSVDPAYLGARAEHLWWGPVTLHRGSEPYMTVAVAGARASAGVAIAEINLKLIWDVISAIHIGRTGEAFVLDRSGELVAHPDKRLLNSHRAMVAVIFCDLRGFTSFSSHAEPDEVMGLLAEYHRALGEIIVRYGATLTCYMGDGLMLLLNAPVPCDDPATLAARMAIEMQRSIQDLILEWRARGHAIGFGIGIATGEATVGRIGYEGRIDYTAIGPVVNLAARLCSSAADGQVIIDSSTAAALGDALLAEPLGGRSIRGLAEPTAIFALKQPIKLAPID